jgi:hypothetical protein
MHTQIPPLFRSYAEMDDVYQRLHGQGKDKEPYVVTAPGDNQTLYFFGCRHSNDIGDPQNSAIEALWHEFAGQADSDKIAFCEGGLRPIEASRDESIKKYSEPGLLTWLARQDGVEMVSPEPDETKEIEYLISQGFNSSQMMTYYFGRQMYQWVKRDHINHDDWKAYATHYIGTYAKLKPLQSDPFSLQSVLEMFQHETGQPFSIDAEDILYELSAPTSNSVSAASGTFRDISLLASITEAWQQHKSIFAVYGSGHAIVLEQALRNLAN